MENCQEYTITIVLVKKFWGELVVYPVRKCNNTYSKYVCISFYLSLKRKRMYFGFDVR